MISRQNILRRSIMNTKISTKDNGMFNELSLFLTVLNKKADLYQPMVEDEKLCMYLKSLKNLLKGQFMQLKEEIDNG